MTASSGRANTVGTERPPRICFTREFALSDCIRDTMEMYGEYRNIDYVALRMDKFQDLYTMVIIYTLFIKEHSDLSCAFNESHDFENRTNIEA